MTYGSELALKEAGKIRVEGKEYLCQDGDIMFNITDNKLQIKTCNQ